MIELVQYKNYFISDDGQGRATVMDKDANVLKECSNALGCKMWIEIETNPVYADLKEMSK